MQKRKLTQEDFINNPILPELGFKIGDEVEIPEANESNEEATNGGDAEDDDTGGSNPPPSKERP